MRQASRRMVAVVAVAAFVMACILIVGSGGFTFDTLAANGTLTPWAYLPFIARQPTPTPTPIACSTVPILISPVDGSNLDTRIPLFTVDCGSSPNATELVIEVHSGDAPKVTGPAHIGCTQGICKWRQDCNLHPAVTYHWYAYLMCGETQGPCSEEWWFTTGSGGTMLPAPTLRSPANGSALSGTSVTLKWSSVSGAVEYQVCMYGRDDRLGTVEIKGDDMLEYEVPRYGQTAHSVHSLGRICRLAQGTQIKIYGLAEDTAYSWWVTARNDYAWGTESASWSFTTNSSEARTSPHRSYHWSPDGQ